MTNGDYMKAKVQGSSFICAREVVLLIQFEATFSTWKFATQNSHLAQAKTR
jgi:hypothetical protein